LRSFSVIVFLIMFIIIHLPSLFSSSFLLMLPPPPRSTLFPYTTLFRSARNRLKKETTQLGFVGIYPSKPDRTIISGSPTLPANIDRKSTRLNSSHDQISYAVFCLKKKKKKTCTL